MAKTNLTLLCYFHKVYCALKKVCGKESKNLNFLADLLSKLHILKQIAVHELKVLSSKMDPAEIGLIR
jgi:hypothetical protein